jgi:hypothetical protein
LYRHPITFLDHPHAPAACLRAVAVRLFWIVSDSSVIAFSTVRSSSGSQEKA